jgi:hypothetical protein
VNVIGAIAAGAAGLAAVLAGVNLYVSGRRELNKWTRETLVELFVSFLETSFAHNHCRQESVAPMPGFPAPLAAAAANSVVSVG